jgi:hypothetical protein
MGPERPIKERQTALFDRWRIERPEMVMDGLVNEAEYANAKPRVVFLFKEVNSPNVGKWDLVEDQLIHGAVGHTWYNAARWTFGIQNLNRDVKWEEVEECTTEFRIQALRRSCYINLKKSPGGSSSRADEIESVATQDFKFIQEQIRLYSPELIVCGGTGDLFFKLCGKVREEWDRTSRGVYWFRTAENIPVIAMEHPAAHVRANLLFYSLVDAVKEVLATKRA